MSMYFSLYSVESVRESVGEAKAALERARAGLVASAEMDEQGFIPMHTVERNFDTLVEEAAKYRALYYLGRELPADGELSEYGFTAGEVIAARGEALMLRAVDNIGRQRSYRERKEDEADAALAREVMRWRSHAENLSSHHAKMDAINAANELAEQKKRRIENGDKTNAEGKPLNRKRIVDALTAAGFTVKSISERWGNDPQFIGLKFHMGGKWSTGGYGELELSLPKFRDYDYEKSEEDEGYESWSDYRKEYDAAMDAEQARVIALIAEQGLVAKPERSYGRSPNKLSVTGFVPPADEVA